MGLLKPLGGQIALEQASVDLESVWGNSLARAKRLHRLLVPLQGDEQATAQNEGLLMTRLRLQALLHEGQATLESPRIVHGLGVNKPVAWTVLRFGCNLCVQTVRILATVAGMLTSDNGQQTNGLNVVRTGTDRRREQLLRPGVVAVVVEAPAQRHHQLLVAAQQGAVLQPLEGAGRILVLAVKHLGEGLDPGAQPVEVAGHGGS